MSTSVDDITENISSAFDSSSAENRRPSDPNPSENISQTSQINLDDTVQLEYDENDMDLIAHQVDDDVFEYDASNATKTGNLLKTQISSDGIIDDDFESELGGCQTTEFFAVDEKQQHAMKQLASYGIVEYVGDDKFGRKILICSGCRLPTGHEIHQTEYQTVDQFYDCFFNYILKEFDQYVNMDYVIIYFHRGLNSNSRPAYGWLMRAYRSIDRKFKKNLKALYIVHPTLWIKFLWPFLRSIISSKFADKVMYIDELRQLSDFVHLDRIPIPFPVETDGFATDRNLSMPIIPSRKFQVPLAFILEQESEHQVPSVMRETIIFIKKYGLETEEIFCRSAPIPILNEIQNRYNIGQTVEFEKYADVHVAATMLKIFLRNLTEPLLTYRLYPELIGVSALRRHHQIDIVRALIIDKLPHKNYFVLKYLVEFLNLVSSYADNNQMTAKHLALVFGSNLAWSDDVSMNNLENYALINQIIETLIAHYTELFLK